MAQADSPDSHYPDAHYNLAFVCEKLGEDAEAQQLGVGISDRLYTSKARRWSVAKLANGPREFMFSIYGGRGGLRTGSLLFVAKGLNE